jgi:hypothetical protein
MNKDHVELSTMLINLEAKDDGEDWNVQRALDVRPSVIVPTEMSAIVSSPLASQVWFTHCWAIIVQHDPELQAECRGHNENRKVWFGISIHFAFPPSRHPEKYSYLSITESSGGLFFRVEWRSEIKLFHSHHHASDTAEEISANFLPFLLLTSASSFHTSSQLVCWMFYFCYFSVGTIQANMHDGTACRLNDSLFRVSERAKLSALQYCMHKHLRWCSV